MARPTSRAREQKIAAEAARRQQEEARRSRRRSLLIGGGAVAAVAAVVAFVLMQPPPPGIEFPSQGNAHIASVTDPHPPYNSSPPSSGHHLGSLARWEEHEEPVPPELFVHNLEDGGIVLTYDCPEGCDDILEGLREVMADNTGKHVMLTPYEGITHPETGERMRGAAVAWTRVFYFDEWTPEVESEVRTFINLYEGIDHHVR